MAINSIEDLFFALDRWGFTDVLLPFLLIFAIIFAVLQKTKLLGVERKNVNTIVALVMGLLFVIPHVTHAYPPYFDPVEIMNKALPATSLVIVAIVMFLILIGMFGADLERTGFPLGGAVMFISLALIIFIFGASAGWWATNLNYWIQNLFGEDAIAIVILIIVFGLIVSFITGGEDKDKNRLKDDFRKLFGGQ